MIAKHIWLCIISGCLTLSGCTSTVLTSSWTDPNFSGQVDKVFVVGLASQERTRRMFEDEVVNQLTQAGVSGVQSYLTILDSENLEEVSIARNVANVGANAILIAYASGQRTEGVVNPGRITSTGPSGSSRRSSDWNRSHHFRTYFDRHRTIIYEPSTITEFEVIEIEAHLYDAKTGQQIWSGQLETVLERDLRSLLSGFVRTVVSDLKSNNLIGS